MITQEDIDAMQNGMEDELLNKLCDERKENTSLMERIEQLERELAAEKALAEPVAWHGQTGVKDKDGRMICVGDRIRIDLTSKNTKEEYWLPEYVVEWVPPSFKLKYVGGGKDSDTARWKFSTPQPSTIKVIETVSATPAPVVPVEGL